MSEEKEKPDWITRVAAGFVKVFMQFLLAVVWMVLWNGSLTQVFSTKPMNLIQAWCCIMLITVAFRVKETDEIGS